MCAFLGGCVGGDAITGDRRNVGVVSMVFSARPARVRLGEVVHLSLRLFNNAGTSQDVTFPREQIYDFWAERDGREVWRWSSDRTFGSSSVTLTLESQSPETYTEPWTPTDSGSYEVFGSFASGEYERPLGGKVIVE